MKLVAACLLLASLMLATPATAADVAAPPAWINAQSIDDAVELTWAAVDGATAYNVYRNDELMASTPSTDYLDTAAILGAVYQVAAIVDGIEGQAATAVFSTTEEGDAGLFLSPPCIPTTLGGDFPFVDVDWDCLDSPMSDSSMSAQVLWVHFCTPIGIGGSDPPFVGIHWDCLDEIGP